MPRLPLNRPATYDDLVAQPDHLVAEIVDGELWTSPRPAPRHARLDSGRWTIAATYVDDDVIRPEPFVDADLELGLLWEGSRAEPSATNHA